MQFIDLHGHYAWDIDDGIRTMDDSRLALQRARDNHITTLVATPHVICGDHNLDDIKDIKQRIDDLKQLAKEYDINVLSGCELFLNHDSLQAIKDDLFIPIENTHYLLVEFDIRKELGKERDVEDILYEIKVKGYTPVIAHVERYFQDKVDIERVEDLIDMGYIIQVNSSSLLGVHGKTIQKNALNLLDQGLVHIIASDTHRPTGHRVPNLLDVYDHYKKRYSEHTMMTLMYDNPLHIIKDEEVECIEKRQSFFKRLLKGE